MTLREGMKSGEDDDEEDEEEEEFNDEDFDAEDFRVLRDLLDLLEEMYNKHKRRMVILYQDTIDQ